MEATRIVDFTAWPSHDNTDRIDFGKNYVGVITTYFKDICENSDVKIADTFHKMGYDKVKFVWKAG